LCRGGRAVVAVRAVVVVTGGRSTVVPSSYKIIGGAGIRVAFLYGVI